MIIMQKLKFSSAKIKQIEEDFSKVQLTPEIRKVMIGVTEVLAKYIPIQEVSLRGFVLFSIQDAQKELKLFVKDIKKMPKDKKLMFIKTVFGNIEERLMRILANKDENNAEILHKAIIEAYKFRISQNI